MPDRPRQVSLGRLMVLVAIVAASLALLQALPRDSLVIPTFWVLLGVIDFVTGWKLVLRRPLRASHYVFLILFEVGALVLINQVAAERFLPLTFLLHGGPGARPISLPPGIAVVRPAGDLWTAVAIALLIAWACGAFAGRLERRRGWDVAAVCRGMLLGFALACLFGVLQHALLGPVKESILANWIALAIAVPLLGWLGRSWFRSAYLGDPTPASPLVRPSAAPGPRAPAS
jgi:hypothetical protein